MSVTQNTTVIDALNLFRLRLSHAVYGKHDKWQGRNKFCFNRIFMIYGRERKKYGEVTEKSGERTGQTMSLMPGHIYFMPYNADLEFEFFQGMQIIAFHFNMELFPGRDLFEKHGRCEMLKDRAGVISSVLEGMKKPESAAAAANIMTAILKICAPLLRDETEDMHHIGLMRRKYSIILESLEKDNCARLSVKELAAKSGIHRDTLSKAFAADTGIPLKKYMEQRIMAKATEKLLYSDRKIREISAELGFANEQYFSIFFRKHARTTPEKFRQSRTPLIPSK